MTKFFIILFFFSSLCFAQVEIHKWKAQEVDYKLPQAHERSTSINTSDFTTMLVSTAQLAYHKLFSEYDGDNCPFHPSCSSFLVEAVSQTNIFIGSLMFADRFSRDINFFKGFENYPIHTSGKFFDPVYKYVLDLKSNPSEIENVENDN